jgi:hypothetical protein
MIGCPVTQLLCTQKPPRYRRYLAYKVGTVVPVLPYLARTRYRYFIIHSERVFPIPDERYPDERYPGTAVDDRQMNTRRGLSTVWYRAGTGYYT